MFHPEFVCPNAGVCIPWKQRFRVPFYWVRELAVEWMSESWVNMMRLLFTRHLQCVTVFHTSSHAGCHWFGNICIQNPWYNDNSTILRADLKNQSLSPSLPSSFPPSPPRYPISLSLSHTHTFSQIRGSRKHPIVLLWDELLRLIDVGLIGVDIISPWHPSITKALWTFKENAGFWRRGWPAFENCPTGPGTESSYSFESSRWVAEYD